MKKKILSIALVGTVCALICLLGVWVIPMPLPVPMTLQTFAVALAGYVLGVKKGSICVACYIALGALGVPVFSGFRGGLGVLFDFGGGFIWGFLPLCMLCALGRNRKAFLSFLIGLAGLLLCHGAGVLYYSFSANADFLSAILAVSLPFILKDASLIALAVVFWRATKKRINKITRI